MNNKGMDDLATRYSYTDFCKNHAYFLYGVGSCACVHLFCC